MPDTPDAADTQVLADDRQRLLAISAAVSDPRQLAGLVFEYWHDGARADRASRALMYLHLGMLVGVITRLTAERRTP